MFEENKKFALTKPEEIDRLSRSLNSAVRVVLGLDLGERIFVGNEEKLFLWLLVITIKCGVVVDPFEMNKMGDVFDLAPQKNNFASGSGPLKSLRKFCLRYYFHVAIIFNLVRIFIGRKKQLIHYAAHLRPSFFVVPNINESISIPKVHNQEIRHALRNALQNFGVNEEGAEIISKYFPSSHLENYHFYRNHFLTRLKLRFVFTSIYGVMLDPMLASMIRMQNPKLLYVQHGGSYGFGKNTWHDIECHGADEMLYWGVGDKNVYPTRYKTRNKSKKKGEIIILCNYGISEEKLAYYEDYISTLNKINGRPAKIVLHPRSSVLPSNVHQIGISEKQFSQAKLVIFDGIDHSLIYAAIVAKMHFFVILPSVIEPNFEAGKIFFEKLIETGCAFSRDELQKKTIEYLNSHRNCNADSINLNDFYEYINKFPKLRSYI